MIKPYKKRIYGFECDLYGHLHNTNYLNILEAARSDALVDVGMPVIKLLELGWHVYIRKMEMEFLQAVQVDELVEVHSKILKMNKLRSTWKQELYKQSGELCFVAYIHVVHIFDGKPARVPESIWEHFKLLGNDLEEVDLSVRQNKNG